MARHHRRIKLFVNPATGTSFAENFGLSRMNTYDFDGGLAAFKRHAVVCGQRRSAGGPVYWEMLLAGGINVTDTCKASWRRSNGNDTTLVHRICAQPEPKDLQNVESPGVWRFRVKY